MRADEQTVPAAHARRHGAAGSAPRSPVMRLEQKNRRSCILLLAALAVLIGVIIWMALGGVSSQSLGDDVKADFQTPAPQPVGRPNG